MGLLDIFRRAPKRQTPAPNLDGFWPIYTQYGTSIYNSDVVQQALKCIVDEMKKLNPTHIRYNGADPVPVKDDLQELLQNPNEIMTASEFLEKTTWLLLLNYNAFIVPTYYTWTDENTGATRRKYTALYPIKPSEVDFIQDAETGRLYVSFRFNNGYKTTLDYADVIHIKYNYSVNQYMGGNELGQPETKAILETVELNNALLRGVAKSLNASYAVNGIVRYNTVMDGGKTERALQELERKLRNSESGFLPLDLKADFTPIQRASALVDPATLEFVDEKILRNWGVPRCILTGEYTKDQYEAFYQKTLEPLIIAISQAFTKKLFTEREKAFGNKVELYPKELIFMTVSQTLDMINALAPTGALYENEKRVALGLRPLPELEGKRYMSLNWIDATQANAYQVGANEQVEVVDEVKEEA